MTELSKEAKAAKNAYQKQWREANPKKIQQYGTTYWEKKAGQPIQERTAKEPTPPQPQQQDNTLSEIESLRLEGNSVREIADRLGISKSKVSRLCPK